jgi:Na+/citrate or Na+/malate symporter
MMACETPATAAGKGIIAGRCHTEFGGTGEAAPTAAATARMFKQPASKQMLGRLVN